MSVQDSVQHPFASADSHVNEPPELWTKSVPSNMAERVPAVVRGDGGHDAWVLAPDIAPRAVATSAVAGTRPQDFMKRAVTYKEMRPGSFDPGARLDDMDVDGVWAEVLYPGIARALDLFADAEVRRWCADVYNDWIAEFQAVSPGRLVGLAILPPLDDGRSTQRTLERAIALGLRGAYVPTPADGRPLAHPDSEGFWALAEDADIPISLHVGSSRAMVRNLVNPGDRNVPGVNEAFVTAVPFGVAELVAQLIFSGLLSRRPGLRIVIAEAGLGWMPFLLKRMEDVYDRHRHYMDTREQRSPTEVFKTHFYVTFQWDRLGPPRARSRPAPGCRR